jgi:SHS2 domain-containing protein
MRFHPIGGQVPFRYLTHTGDLRAALEAKDEAGLYRCAVDLFRDLVVGDSPVEPRQQRRLELGGGSRDERFFRFLRELVYLYDAEGFLPAAVEPGDPVILQGETFDAQRHHSERQPKALTRHGYRFVVEDGRCEAEVVFDL